MSTSCARSTNLSSNNNIASNNQSIQQQWVRKRRGLQRKSCKSWPKRRKKMPQKPTPNRANPPPPPPCAAPSTNNKTPKAAAPPSPPVYRLANIPSSLDASLSDSYTIKACLALLARCWDLCADKRSNHYLIWRPAWQKRKAACTVGAFDQKAVPKSNMDEKEGSAIQW